MILDQIAASARKRVEEKKKAVSYGEIKRRAYERLENSRVRNAEGQNRGEEGEDGNTETGRDGERVAVSSELPPDRFPFHSALARPGVSFICEVKRASPSKGLIAPDFPYVEIGREYERAGADAISVLTEPEFFMGSDRYLEEIHKEVSLPILRKDFTVDPYQIYEAKTLGASAVLLIVSLMGKGELKDCLKICRELELSALTEAHTEEETVLATEAGARIIGINNRNLKTFEVDFSNALRLRRLVDRDTIFVAESGIRSREDIIALAQARVDGVLIGETLMRAADKRKALADLRPNGGRRQWN